MKSPSPLTLNVCYLCKHKLHNVEFVYFDSTTPTNVTALKLEMDCNAIPMKSKTTLQIINTVCL